MDFKLCILLIQGTFEFRLGLRDRRKFDRKRIIMHRVQLFEFEDLRWCPQSLRDTITDSIHFGIKLTNVYAAIVPRLRNAISKAKADRIIDFGSGAGGPWPRLAGELNNDGTNLQILLTDIKPNVAALNLLVLKSEGKIDYLSHSVNARDNHIPNGFRTFFSSFHHFRPSDTRTILENAIAYSQGIGIFELTSRKPESFLTIFFMPLMMILMGIFMRPFRLSRLFWIYLIPAAPIFGFLDGIISCFRTYSITEATQLVQSLKSENYEWQMGVERSRFLRIPITYLIGYPRQK
jgi:hypothetical protein